MAKYILAAGGETKEGYSKSDAVDIFKVTDDGIEKVLNHGLKLSEACLQPAVVSCGKYILVMGGYREDFDSVKVDVFEMTETGVIKGKDLELTLDRMIPDTMSREGLAAASCGNYILAMGGVYTTAIDVFKVSESGIEKIDPGEHGLKLSTARAYLTAVTCGQYIFAMGGRTVGGVYYDTVDVFKVTDSGVEMVPDHGLKLSVARNNLSSVSAGNYVFAIGGEIDGEPWRTNVVDVFKVTDTGFVTERKLKLKYRQVMPGVAAIGDIVLAGNGQFSFGDVIEVFKITPDGVFSYPNDFEIFPPMSRSAGVACDKFILFLGNERSLLEEQGDIEVFEVVK